MQFIPNTEALKALPTQEGRDAIVALPGAEKCSTRRPDEKPAEWILMRAWKIWWWYRDLNLGHQHYECCALTD